jgi:hypothetical protein
MDGSPKPVREQDPTDKADYAKRDFLDQTKGQSEVQNLPTGTGLDGGGFNEKRNITQYPTKTWSGEKGQHDPVTREALSHTQDPNKNPIREILEAFGGHLMPQQVESALKDWEVG